MEHPTASVKKVALPYGAILGLLTVFLSVIVYVMDLTYEQPWWQGLIGFLFLIAVIVYGLKTFKTNNSGFLSLTEAIKVGLAITLVSALIGVVFNLIFMYVIEPDFTANMLAANETKMIEQNPNMTQEQIDMSLGISETIMSPAILSAISVIMALFFGFIVSLISGLVMKNKRPEHI
ncbi:MAG: DUF4199 domain-containing protein [Marinirhabdus sp.]|nr:DUF4199 domain-containing protein [Marinirhabdus sp.]